MCLASLLLMVFGWVLASYFVPLVMGYVLGKSRKVKAETIYRIGQRLSDPYTLRIHKWSMKYKLRCIKEGNWVLFFLLVFLNNLLLVAFISRILYGMVFFIPLLLTIWTGFAQGVFFSRKMMVSPTLVFEFGGYLFASVIGIYYGQELLFFLINNDPINPAIPVKYLFFCALFVSMGSLTETLGLRMASKYTDFSQIEKMDVTKKKENLVRDLDRD